MIDKAIYIVLKQNAKPCLGVIHADPEIEGRTLPVLAVGELLKIKADASEELLFSERTCRGDENQDDHKRRSDCRDEHLQKL